MGNNPSTSSKKSPDMDRYKEMMLQKEFDEQKYQTIVERAHARAAQNAGKSIKKTKKTKVSKSSKPKSKPKSKK